MFGPDVEAAARAHALQCHPQEACGLVVDGVYRAVDNVAADPVKHFEMAPDAWTAFGRVQAVIHSHGPGAQLAPSANDMRHQIASAVPWGIVHTDGVITSPILWFGDHRLEDPLVGRPFVHGVTDCYALIRSWYWQQQQIRLPEFPRDDEWWAAGGNLYDDGFGRAGFAVIPAAQASIGDVALINFRSKVPNHGGVLVEGELLLHHLRGRNSCREPIGRWHGMISKWLRYVG